MGLEPVAVEKMDFGPCAAYFGESSSEKYLGRTQGETQVQYGIDTSPLETEEDGLVDEVVNNDNLVVTIPLIYTDVDSLSNIIPWGNVVANGEDKKLEIPKAIGKRLSQYAKPLRIHPLTMADEDKSKDITIHKCYPKPGPINFNYSRDGKRIANVTFVAMEAANGSYLTIGDPSITAA